MQGVAFFLLDLALCVGLGILGYYAYTRVLPQSFRDKLAGIKTKVLGIAVGIAPDVLNLLVAIQALGTSWEPTPTVTWVMRGIGVVIVVLRFITDKEQGS